MRRRLYYLLPDSTCAREIMDDLLLARIEERHIHFIAKAGAPMEGLHEANILQTTDVVHGAQQGALIGAALGCALGLVLAYFVIPDPAWHVPAVVLASLFGAGFGMWTASLAGAAVPNSRHKGFAADIAGGKFLLIVDVPEHKVQEAQALLNRIHPEAKGCGVEVNIPYFRNVTSRSAPATRARR